MLNLEWHKLEWWYWLVADVLLILAMFVERDYFVAALTFNLAQAIHIGWRRRSLQHFSTQVRIAYLLWMLAGLLPGMVWMHWIQLVGTNAMLSVGYCPLARLLSLFPWNRRLPLTWKLVLSTFLAPPNRGSILRNPAITA